MLKAGIHPKIVSERMGHGKISVTLDIYSHVLPGLQEAAAERFDKMLEGRVKNEANNGQEMESVSKPLAKNGDLNGGAKGTIGRTFSLTFSLY